MMAFGISTIADAVQAFFHSHPEYDVTLENVSDELVKLAVHYVLTNPVSSDLVDWLSQKSTH